MKRSDTYSQHVLVSDGRDREIASLQSPRDAVYESRLDSLRTGPVSLPIAVHFIRRM